MLVCMAVNQELAVGASLQRSTTVCWPSGECSSSSLRGIGIGITGHGEGKTSSLEVVPQPRRRGAAHLFSKSGMVRFLLMKHIFRLMTFLSLEVAEPPCLGEPESSLPL